MIKRNARNNSKLEFDNSENLSTISKLSEEQQKDNTGLFFRVFFSKRSILIRAENLIRCWNCF